MLLFRDRRHAGSLLAPRLRDLRRQDAVVMALPRGGVPVGHQLATTLDLTLDVLVVRKLGCPWQRELAVGAIAEDGVEHHDDGLLTWLGIGPAELSVIVREETDELARNVRRYRRGRPPTDVRGREVVVVDDGIATGETVLAALETLRRRGAADITVATPVAPPEIVHTLSRVVPRLECVQMPSDFDTIGRYYRDFLPVTDEEVIALLDEAQPVPPPATEVDVALPTVTLPGLLQATPAARGAVVFAHGAGSSRLSPRNREVADALSAAGYATLLFDLLTPDEDRDRASRFAIGLLADRLAGATRWLTTQFDPATVRFGYFGASTGSAAALRAATDPALAIAAIVSRGGRPDLAGADLHLVTAPTLLIVGGEDRVVIDLNRKAAAELRGEHVTEIVPGAGHLFEEPGALEEVSRLAIEWFDHHLATPT